MFEWIKWRIRERKYVKQFGKNDKMMPFWKYRETWEDYPFPAYNAIHTYCSVAFDDSGKTFYYRTRNPDIKVGDFVYVPVGRKYEKRVGRVVKMRKYRGRFAPYPLERTKYIIGRVEPND